jgi:hypothetical protein
LDTQTLLTVAAVVGSLAGVALGAFLAGRSQQSHWFRDRRLDAFVAAQTAVYQVMRTSRVATGKLSPVKQIEALTELTDALNQWAEARSRLDLLGGTSVVGAADALYEEVLKHMTTAAREADRAAWDAHLEPSKRLRARLLDEMRKELSTR